MPVPLLHGARPILGFRFGTFAYLTDCNAIPDESWPLLDGVEDARARRTAATSRTRRTSRVDEALGRRRTLAPRAPTSRTSATTWGTRRPARAARGHGAGI